MGSAGDGSYSAALDHAEWQPRSRSWAKEFHSRFEYRVLAKRTSDLVKSSCTVANRRWCNYPFKLLLKLSCRRNSSPVERAATMPGPAPGEPLLHGLGAAGLLPAPSRARTRVCSQPRQASQADHDPTPHRKTTVRPLRPFVIFFFVTNSVWGVQLVNKWFWSKLFSVFHHLIISAGMPEPHDLFSQSSLNLHIANLDQALKGAYSQRGARSLRRWHCH